MTTMTVTGEGISVERDVSESTALKIMEIAMNEEHNEDEPEVTISLRGEGMEFDRQISETTGVKAIDAAVHGGNETATEAQSGNDNGLPDDFFNKLSQKQEVMLEILVQADGEWMRGVDIREKMREEYDMDVGQGGRATAGVIAGLTRKYTEELRREIIPGRWSDETQQHAEFRIGNKYEQEIKQGLKNNDS